MLLKISLGFISGTTKGTSGSILNILLLSITVHPLLTAIGIYFLETSPPAQNIA